MDPFMTALLNQGGGFVLAAAILWLHHNLVIAFREEMKLERDRNDSNLTRLFEKFDGLRDAYLDARCKLPEGFPTRPGGQNHM